MMLANSMNRISSFLILSLLVAKLAAQDSNNISISEALSAYRNQLKQFTTLSSDHLTRFDRKDGGSNGELKFKLIRDGEKVRIQQSDKGLELATIWNGQNYISMSNSKSMAAPTIQLSKDKPRGFDLNTSVLHLLGVQVPDANFSMDELNFTEIKRLDDDRVELRGEGQTNQDFKMDYYLVLSISKGFMPVQIRGVYEAARHGGGFPDATRIIDITAFEQLDTKNGKQVWCPSKGSVTTSNAPVIVNLILSNTNLNPELKEDEFNPKLPTGSTVVDKDERKYIRVEGEGGAQERIDKMAVEAKSKSERSYFTLKSVAILLGTVLVFAGVVIWLRRK